MGDKNDAVLAKIEMLEKEVNNLHRCLEKKGVNSKGTKDLFGREFSVPVDNEHKATALVISNFANPHNRAFHTSWFAFFSSFFSMFAAAPLIMFIRKPTALNLTPADIGTANILAVSSNIVMRAVTGFLCDIFGPRRALAFLLFLTAPPIFGMMFVQDAAGFQACRCFIGIGLATFVTSQVWCSQMFNKSIVGLANATSAGWGNLGGGVTNLLMPFIHDAFYQSLKGEPLVREDRAWRLAYIVPLVMHIVGGCAALTGRDLPDGNIKELESSGAKQKSKGSIVLKTGLSNLNAWVFVLTYGMCFGVELTMNSVAAIYFHDYHANSTKVAGLFASIYGLMNLWARSLGGLISDAANKRYGMRGRLWACWLVQTIEGVFCVIMGYLTLGMDAPFPENREQVVAWTKMDLSKAQQLLMEPNEYQDGWVRMNHTDNPIMIGTCGVGQSAPSQWFQDRYEVGDTLRVYSEPPFGREGAAANCISNQGMSGQVVLMMILFSICVQAAEGLHYGIVPYVSRPALGIVSGMVGAGGNLGSVIALSAFFKGADIRTDQGFVYLGIMVIAITALILFVYFPDMGSMLFPAGGLGSYNPQLIKPPADYRGADSIDFAAVKDKDVEKTSTTNDVVDGQTASKA